MAITVTGTNPTAVTVVSDTITTNTIYNGRGTNDRIYQIADAIAGMVNAGIQVSGGLQLQTTLAGSAITMVNNGDLLFGNGVDPVLYLVGNGGAVTYSGTGTIAGYGERALGIVNVGAGSVGATVGGNIDTEYAEAVHIDTVSGAVNFTQAAQTLISIELSDFAGVRIETNSGNIVANLNGTIDHIGGGIGADFVSTSGNITVNVTGSIFSIANGIDCGPTTGAITINSSGYVSGLNGIEAAANGAGLITVNVTAGWIDGWNNGIHAVANGTGGILINMTGGTIGTQTFGDTGIFANVGGAAGDLKVTSTTIFADDNAIELTMAAIATGDLSVTANGMTSSSMGIGIEVQNFGTGTTTVNINGTVTGAIGVADFGGATTVNNNGSVTGTGGIAILLGFGDDTYKGAAGVVSGAIAGGTGNDKITTGAGANTLNGNANNDTLDGGIGADTMTGGSGDDLYVVDNAGDTIVENVGQGNDVVRTSTSYKLAAGVSVETLEILKTFNLTPIKLTGNAFGNTINGNAANNVINGGGGIDTMTGAAGNDSYIVDSAADKIVESVGKDNVNASVNYTLAAGVSVETLRTIDPAAMTAINLKGNDIANFVTGNAGANVINGGLGNDTLTGNAGADVFAFNTALNAATNVDTIADFSVLADKIRLENSGIFTGLVAGVLNADAFHKGAVAADAEDRIVYNSATGELIYDSNGNVLGGATKFAQLTAGLSLTNNQFEVV